MLTCYVLKLKLWIFYFADNKFSGLLKDHIDVRVTRSIFGKGAQMTWVNVVRQGNLKIIYKNYEKSMNCFQIILIPDSKETQ